jgi:hypothetical protein
MVELIPALASGARHTAPARRKLPCSAMTVRPNTRVLVLADAQARAFAQFVLQFVGAADEVVTAHAREQAALLIDGDTGVVAPADQVHGCVHGKPQTRFLIRRRAQRPGQRSNSLIRWFASLGVSIGRHAAPRCAHCLGKRRKARLPPRKRVFRRY